MLYAELHKLIRLTQASLSKQLRIQLEDWCLVLVFRLTYKMRSDFAAEESLLDALKELLQNPFKCLLEI